MAVRFNGSNTYLHLGSAPNYNSAYTVAFWYYHAQLVPADTWRTAFGFGNSTDSQAMELTQIDPDEHLDSWISWSPGQFQGNAGTTALQLGEWYHVTMVRSSTTNLQFYLNGASETTNNFNVTQRPSSNVTEIGRTTGDGEWANCRIAHVKVWTSNLTGAQIAAEMDSATPVVTSNLWAYWPLASHTDLTDASGNGRHLTGNGTLATEDGPPLGTDASVTAVVAAATATAVAPSVAGSSAGIARVGTNYALGQAVADYVDIPFPSANTAGNLLVVCVAQDSEETLAAVTDTQGNTYYPVFPVSMPSSSNVGVIAYVNIYYAYNCRGGANTVRVNGGRYGSSTQGATICEYSGALTTDPLDRVPTYSRQTSGATRNTTTTGTLAQANELAVAIVSINESSSTFTPYTAGGWSQLGENESWDYVPFSSVDQVVSSTAALSAQWTVGATTQPSVAIIATFKAAASGTNGSVTSVAAGASAASVVPTVDGTTTGTQTTLNLQVSAGADDVYEADSGGGADLTESRIQATAAYADFDRRTAGLRFTNVTIPAGATITSAYLSLYMDVDWWDDLVCHIHAEDVDDSASFTTNGSLITRTRTTANVAWSQANLGTGWKQGPDISSVIAEVVGRAGWQSGNALTVIMKSDTIGVSGTISPFSFQSYDGDSTHGAKLDVTYTASGGTNGSVTSVAATATAAAPAPTVSAVRSASVTSVVATATAAARTPTVSAVRTATVTAVPSGATAASPTPAVSGIRSPTVSAARALATGAAVVPTVSAIRTESITAVVSTAAASAPSPSVTTSSTATVTAVPAAATSTAPSPTVSAIRNPTVIAAVAAATSTAPTPTVSAIQNPTVTAAISIATAGCPAPVVAGTSVQPGTPILTVSQIDSLVRLTWQFAD
jgi:hypothetical protein